MQIFFSFLPSSKIYWITCLLLYKKWLRACHFWSVSNPSNCFYAVVRPYKSAIYNTVDIVILLMAILFCFTTSSFSYCSIETGCNLIDTGLWIISAVFFPFYAIVILVYKIFPKSICKSFQKYIFCGC